MMKEKTTNVAKALTVQLHATEEAIDTALSEAANLIEAYVSSRRAIRLSASAVGDVHESTLKAMLALNMAQRHMTDAHKALSIVQTHIGLSPSAIIPPYDKPEPPPRPGTGGITGNALMQPSECAPQQP